ncbi:hypothetical protein CRM22_003666 [Opisthorchis felineus]|uniref:TAFII55 protein conserved region domain-containing protein n=1 Tax=Opisthorchis felineus TaxID=147828 RepID=A0A4S2M059_OPIFE|nr:hypothetical protein CRM22_003666 [Opisthorchis felineus]TGZ69582.1 hypothetical protein CRM22_003666 [Opisthorchis felineus]TGZ69583.1 hypothetical protein CRM22_003666 [Opisthorchis felineus]
MSSKLPSDSSYDLEQQFILRMTDLAAAENLAADIDAGVSFKDTFTLELKPDMRHGIVRYNNQVYEGRLMDLPCIIESLKTTDKRSFYKTADICQMMICTQGEDSGPLRGTAAYLDDRTRSWKNVSDASRENREFQFLHGITPPLKNVLRRRFRKSRRKRFVDMPKIEKEVKQLLRADLQAVTVKWEVIWSDPPSSATRSSVNDANGFQGSTQRGRLGSNILSSSMTVSRTGTRNAAADDELEEDEEGSRTFPVDQRDVFGDISSSSVDSSDSSGGGGASDDERAADGPKKQPDESLSSRATFALEREDADRGGLQSSVGPGRSSDSFVDVAGLGSLKDELAAELLLSDSGDEADEAPSAAHQLHDDDELEGDLQASVAAQLVAHAVSDAHLIHDEDSVVVDDVDDDIDDDEMVHRGGELLDDATLIGLGNQQHRFISHLESDEETVQ